MFLMTEKKLRAIVRDEIEAACLDYGGIYDEARLQSFTLTRATIRMIAENVLKTLPEREGENEATRASWEQQRREYNP